MKSESSEAMTAGCLFALIGVVVGSVFRAFALAKLWGWFVVAKFHLPALGIAEAMGLALVIGAFVPLNTKSEKKDGDETVLQLGLQALLLAALYPLMILGMGWIVKGFL